jgi:micrococcal nuclease
MALPPWLPLIALVVAAGAGHLAVGSPNSVPAIRSVQLSGTSSGVALTGTFRLCAMMHQPNCVVDGDTIRYGGVRIRLADIDAPEISDPKCASEAALGDRATQRLLQLLNAGPFQIVRAGGRDEDKYGRKLRIIVRDGRSVEAKVWRAVGMARGEAGAPDQPRGYPLAWSCRRASEITFSISSWPASPLAMPSA